MNSKRFISAFNLLDKTVRKLYGVKSNLGFSEMIRQTCNKNAVLRHYQNELYDYSRLRNAIVHNDIGDEVIAEPHIKVVEKLEHILQQLRTPPLAIDILHQERVQTANACDTLQTFLADSAKNNFTHLPVYDDGKVVGVINPKYVTEALGAEILRVGYIDKQYLASATIGRIMGRQSDNYIFESALLTAAQAIAYFQDNRRLKAILITPDGSPKQPVLRIITASDAVEFQKQIF